MMEQVEEILKVVSEELGGLVNGDAVLGSAVKLGDATVYPISLVSLGMGGGGGEGETTTPAGGRSDKGIGGGSAGGARACPVAVLVFTGEGVKVLPLPHRRGPVERLLDKIPELLDRMKGKA